MTPQSPTGLGANPLGGMVQYDSGRSFEYLAVRHGHYPKSWADAKGAEPEGVTVGQYGN